MRMGVMVVLLGSIATAQSLVEHSAAAAGGAVGGVAGKKVSDGLTSIFEKVDKQAAKAAGEKAAKARRANEPVFDVGPGVPHASASPTSARSYNPNVPPPPPAARRRHAAPVAEAAEIAPPEPVVAPVPPPPPPVATAADLKNIKVGERRDAVVKLGFPAIHITMYDNGHLLESYRYITASSDVGVVRLTDGAVSSIQVN